MITVKKCDIFANIEKKRAKINHVFLMASSQYPNQTIQTAEHLEMYKKGKVANDNIPEANVWNDLSILLFM